MVELRPVRKQSGFTHSGSLLLQGPEITHFWSPKVPSQWYLVIAAPGSIYILNNQALAQRVVV